MQKVVSKALESVASESVRFEAEPVLKKSFVVRLKPGTDLLEGIHAVCEKYGVKAGAVSTLLGSLRRVRFVYPVPRPESLSGLRYCDPIAIEGPIEVLCGAGTIGMTEETGDRFVHLHAAFSDATGRVWGGHLLDSGNPVAVTAELVIEALEGATLTRATDPETAMPIFSVAPSRGLI